MAGHNRAMNPIDSAGRGLEAFPEDLQPGPVPEPRRLREVFGEGEKARRFHAPGRVNLMGAHLDYNGGPVLPLAVDRGTGVLARRARGRELVLASETVPGVVRFELDGLPEAARGHWSDYPLGVVRALLGEGRAAVGLELLYHGDLPVGAGLASSASLCLATAHACDALWELGLTSRERIRAALASERDFVGLPCGILDPTAIELARRGEVLSLDCGSGEYRYLPFDDATLSISVADSGVRRELVSGAYGERVGECRRVLRALQASRPGLLHLCEATEEELERIAGTLAPAELRRARHVLSEVDRTRAAREALRSGRGEELGELLSRTHASLRDDFEVSCPELDALVEEAVRAPGVLGARLVGAGFGGCVLVLHEPGVEAGLAERLEAPFRARFGRESRLWTFASDDGPRELPA